MTEVFFDTSYAVALIVPKDKHHRRARELSGEIQRRRSRLITTSAVLLEIGNSLSGLRHRSKAVSLLEFLEKDPQVEVVPCSDALYQRGLDLFRRRPDKEWSLTDCISFSVMEERRLRESLTTDGHFEQAGFRALLRN